MEEILPLLGLKTKMFLFKRSEGVIPLETKYISMDHLTQPGFFRHKIYDNIIST